MNDRFEREMGEQAERLNKKIKDLQEEIGRLSKNSKMSDAEWLEKLRIKEEEYQKMIQDANKRHIEELQEMEQSKEKAIKDMKKELQDKLAEQ